MSGICPVRRLAASALVAASVLAGSSAADDPPRADVAAGHEVVTVHGARRIALRPPVGVEPTIADIVRSGRRAEALELIAGGVDVDVPEASGNGTTALHWAVYQHDSELVRALLEAGADPSVRNLFGSTPMMEAASVGHTEILTLLLDAGADVESRNYEGQTALMAVARTGNLDAARPLLEAGADPNALESWGGQTAIMWAAARRHAEMIRLLAEHGADTNARSFDRVWERRTTAEPRPKNYDTGGMTAALFAAREGCAECIPVLKSLGADLDLGNRNGVTPLLIALLNLRWDTAIALIEAGADPTQWDVFGRSPVYVAVDLDARLTSGHPDVPSFDETTPIEVLERLLAAGAHPEVPLRQRQPYRNVTFDRGYRDGSGPGITALHRAAEGGLNPAAAALLIRYGADPSMINGTAVLVVGVSARPGNNHSRDRSKGAGSEEDALAMAKALLEAGVDVDQRDPATGKTALHIAVERGHGAVVEFLIRQGASSTAESRSGETPLGLADDRMREIIEAVTASAQPAR
jgi:ankyrin repeat protein